MFKNSQEVSVKQRQEGERLIGDSATDSQRTKAAKEGGSGRVRPNRVGSYWLLQDVGFYAKWGWKPLNDLVFQFYFIFFFIDLF